MQEREIGKRRRGGGSGGERRGFGEDGSREGGREAIERGHNSDWRSV